MHNIFAQKLCTSSVHGAGHGRPVGRHHRPPADPETVEPAGPRHARPGGLVLTSRRRRRRGERRARDQLGKDPGSTSLVRALPPTTGVKVMVQIVYCVEVVVNRKLSSNRWKLQSRLNALAESSQSLPPVM